jgi:8-oxo-dGTP diphosphatase
MRDGKALLGLRKPSGKRGNLWEMPGGKVDVMRGQLESHMIALQREWLEEVGLDVAVGERIATCVLDVEVVFTVTLYEVFATGEPKPLDHVELRWVDLDEAIQTWPCSPAMYMHWPLVRAWLRGHVPTGRMR